VVEKRAELLQRGGGEGVKGRWRGGTGGGTHGGEDVSVVWGLVKTEGCMGKGVDVWKRIAERRTQHWRNWERAGAHSGRASEDAREPE